MIQKATNQFRSLTFSDFVRKLIYTIDRWFSFRFFRKLRCIYHFKATGVTLGRNVRIHGLANNIRIGRQTAFYDNCIFEFSPSAEVIIGSNVVFSYAVVFACRSKISVGNDVQIGEYTSLRDSTHTYSDMDKPIKYQEDYISPITIADNVWIGRNCLISPGSVIEEGVIVAAHSVVKGRLERNGIYGGVPAKLIKYREEKKSI